MGKMEPSSYTSQPYPYPQSPPSMPPSSVPPPPPYIHQPPSRKYKFIKKNQPEKKNIVK